MGWTVEILSLIPEVLQIQSILENENGIQKGADVPAFPSRILPWRMYGVLQRLDQGNLMI